VSEDVAGANHPRSMRISVADSLELTAEGRAGGLYNLAASKIEYDITNGDNNKITFAFIVHEHDVFRFPAPGASRRNLKETSFLEELYVFFIKSKCIESVAVHAFIVPRSPIPKTLVSSTLILSIRWGDHSVDYQLSRVDIVVPVGSLPSQSGYNFRLESSRL
jgi:hypothetical protein